MSGFMGTNIVGRNLSTNTIGALVKESSQMIVFLRHLGCNLSLQLVNDIKMLELKHKVQFPITFVCQGSRAYCDHFWNKKYPTAKVIYDTNLNIAKGFGLREGTLIHVINAHSAMCSIKAMMRGHFPSVFQGNVFMLPGVFVYVEGVRIFSHISQTASDLPEFENLVTSYLMDAVSDPAETAKTAV
jgi:hypothetical protein